MYSSARYALVSHSSAHFLKRSHNLNSRASSIISSRIVDLTLMDPQWTDVKVCILCAYEEAVIKDETLLDSQWTSVNVRRLCACEEAMIMDETFKDSQWTDVSF